MSTPVPPEWRFDRDNPVIKFYLWCWPASIYNLNFCKMFWGLLFSPFAVVVKVVAWPLKNTFLWLAKFSFFHREPTEIDCQEEYKKIQEKNKRKREKYKNSRRKKLLDWMQDRFIGIHMWFDDHKWIGKIAERLFQVVIFGGLGVFLIYTSITETVAMVIVLAIIAVFVLIVTALVLLKEWEVFDKIRDFFVDFFMLLDGGYHGLKNRTCPVILVEGLDEEEKAHVEVVK